LKTYRFLSAASREVEESRNFYDEERPGLGAEFIDELDVTLYEICKQPEIWRNVTANIKRKSIERFPFVVYYAIEEECILVVSVAHQKRRPGYWKKRL